MAKQIQFPKSQPAADYAPEIEARRKHFERLAECLIAQVSLQYEAGALDVSPNDALEPEPGTEHILMDALDSHMKLLFDELQMLEPATIRRFYVDMRLHVEQMRWELKQAAQAKAA